MSISDMIDAAVRCARCGTQGFRKCDCWVDCTCGLHILRGKARTHPVHQTTWLTDGYWIIDSATGRPYKTHVVRMGGIFMVSEMPSGFHPGAWRHIRWADTCPCRCHDGHRSASVQYRNGRD